MNGTASAPSTKTTWLHEVAPMSPRPRLLTFDIFGTVLNWRSGLEASCAAAGRPLKLDEFDRVIDAQARLEQAEFLDYATVTQRSLVDVLGLDEEQAAEIGRSVGRWPLFPDAAALRSLMRIAPCVAMTNSDRSHGEDVQDRLGFRVDGWLCAEDVRLYKPTRISVTRKPPPGDGARARVVARLRLRRLRPVDRGRVRADDRVRPPASLPARALHPHRRRADRPARPSVMSRRRGRAVTATHGRHRGNPQ